MCRHIDGFDQGNLVQRKLLHLCLEIALYVTDIWLKREKLEGGS